MKNFIFTLFAMLVLQFSLMGQTATPPAVGDGTLANPYQIATLENLYWLSQNPAEWSYKYFVQTANIEASASSSWDAGAGWTPIGNSTTTFNSYYYGQGFASGWYWPSSESTASTACTIGFNGGGAYDGDKGITIRVLAVRAY